MADVLKLIAFNSSVIVEQRIDSLSQRELRTKDPFWKFEIGWRKSSGRMLRQCCSALFSFQGRLEADYTKCTAEMTHQFSAFPDDHDQHPSSSVLQLVNFLVPISVWLLKNV